MFDSANRFADGFLPSQCHTKHMKIEIVHFEYVKTNLLLDTNSM